MDFKCQQHKLEAELVCAQNEWHFVPLCGQCMSAHVKSHAGEKVRLMAIDQVTKTVKERQKASLDKAVELTTRMKEKADREKKRQQELKESVEHFKREILQALDLKCAELFCAIDAWAEASEIQQVQSQQAATFIRELEQPSIPTWTRLFFRELGMPPMKEHLKPDIQIASLDEVAKQIMAQVGSMKVQWNERVQNMKKENKVKRKEGRRCKRCGGDMQYVSAFKKSWRCGKCGEKQLNYQKKRIDE